MESMFEKSIEQIRQEQIIDYLNSFCKARHWKDYLSEDKDSSPAELSGNHIILEARTEDNIYIYLLLTKHEKSLGVWLVTSFKVEPCGTNGVKVLAHLGRRTAHSRDKQSDFKSGNLADFFTVTCSKNIEALFREHDNLQRQYKFKPVFDIP